MSARLALLLPLAAIACSSSSAPSSSSTTTDAGATDATIANDAAVGDDDDAALADAGTGEASSQCGPAPWIALGITVTGLNASGGADPLPGARFTSPLCPGSYAISDDAGKLVGQVSKGAVFYGRFDAKNFASMLTPEQSYAADDDTIGVEMLPQLFTALIKGYDATQGTIFIGAMRDNGHDGGTDPCDALDGISFAIAGHPELAPTYYSADAIPAATTGTSTTASGRASFARVPLGEPVTLSGSKPGCLVTFVHGPDTGRAPLEAGYVSLIAAYVRDSASDASSD